MAEQPSTRKVQITVPTADTSVIEWLAQQHSASESVRRLIRESVAREGFVDVANRPVRPPAQPVYVTEDLPSEADPVAEAETVAEADPVAEAETVIEAEPQVAAEADKPPVKSSGARTESTSASATIDDLLGL